MSLKSVTLKERFELCHNEYQGKDGKTSADVSLILPGEGFETFFKPVMYEQCDDPEDAMREEAVKQFEYKLNELRSKYSRLDLSEIEHWYDKDGAPCYQCWYPDCISGENESFKESVDPDGNVIKIPDIRYINVKASDLGELDIRLEIALEDQLGHFPEPQMPEWELFRLSFRKRIEENPELGESDEFWWLLELLVFGIYEEREFARRRLNEMVSLTRNDPYNTNYKATSARDAKKAMYRKMAEPKKLDIMKTFEECSRQGLTLFEDFMNKAVDSGLIHSPSGLALSVGVKPNYLSNARNKKKRLSKAATIRLGIGLHLSPENMTRFLASLDHYFPITDNDFRLCEELKKKNYDLNELVKYLPPERTDENKER